MRTLTEGHSEHDTGKQGGFWDTQKSQKRPKNPLWRKVIKPASFLPADIETAALSEQDVGDLLPVKQQIVLDVSRVCCWCNGLLRLPAISGETHFEVAQGAAGYKALQFFSGKRDSNTRSWSNWPTRRENQAFPV